MAVNSTILLAQQTTPVSGSTASASAPDSNAKTTAEFGRLLNEKHDAANSGTQTAAKMKTTRQDTETKETETKETETKEAKTETPPGTAAIAAIASLAVAAQIQTQEVLPQAVDIQTGSGVAEQAPSVQAATVPTAAENGNVLSWSVQSVQMPVEQPAEQGITAQTATGQTASQQNGAAAVQTVVQVSTQAETAGQKDGSDSGEARQDEQYQIRGGESAANSPLFRRVEAVPVKVGEVPVADTQSPEMDAQITDEIGKALDSGAQYVKIRLSPENLGSVTIDLSRGQDGSLQVVFHPSTDKAADLLTHHSAALTSLLQSDSQADVQVRVFQPREESLYFQQQNQNQSGHGRSGQQEHRQHQESEDFLQQLRLGLIPLDEQAG